MSEYFSKVSAVPNREYRKPSVVSIIIKEFLESSIKVAKLNLKNIPLKAPSTGLRDYIKENEISNVKVYQRHNEIYLEKS
jgi:hypothetical protein